MTAKDIEQVILRQWRGMVWLPQLRIGVGYGPDAERTIDLWGISVRRADLYERIAIEIKVNLGDFRRELALPEKRTWARLFCNRFFFAAPEGAINPAHMPSDCGLIEVSGGYRIVKPCHYTETNRPTWRFVAALARRLSREETTT